VVYWHCSSNDKWTELFNSSFPWIRDIFEEQIVRERVKKFPSLYGTHTFFVIFKCVRYRCRLRARIVQPTFCYTVLCKIYFNIHPGLYLPFVFLRLILLFRIMSVFLILFLPATSPTIIRGIYSIWHVFKRFKLWTAHYEILYILLLLLLSTLNSLSFLSHRLYNVPPPYIVNYAYLCLSFYLGRNEMNEILNLWYQTLLEFRLLLLPSRMQVRFAICKWSFGTFNTFSKDWVCWTVFWLQDTNVYFIWSVTSGFVVWCRGCFNASTCFTDIVFRIFNRCHVMTGPEIYDERPTPNLRLNIGLRHWKLRIMCSYSLLDK
jgi:hypothetical protein